MRIFEAIIAYFRRELVEWGSPFLMFLFFSLSLMRSVPMEWALQKVKSLVLRVLTIIFLIGLYQDVKAQQVELPCLRGDAYGLNAPEFGVSTTKGSTNGTRIGLIPKGVLRDRFFKAWA